MDMVTSGGHQLASRDVLGPLWGAFWSLWEGFLVKTMACFACLCFLGIILEPLEAYCLPVIDFVCDVGGVLFVDPVLAPFWVDFWCSLEHRRVCLDCTGVYGLHIHRFPEKFTFRMLLGALLTSFWHLK